MEKIGFVFDERT